MRNFDRMIIQKALPNFVVSMAVFNDAFHAHDTDDFFTLDFNKADQCRVFDFTPASESVAVPFVLNFVFYQDRRDVF